MALSISLCHRPLGHQCKVVNWSPRQGNGIIPGQCPKISHLFQWEAPSPLLGNSAFSSLDPAVLQLRQHSGNKTCQCKKSFVSVQWECKTLRFVGAWSAARTSPWSRTTHINSLALNCESNKSLQNMSPWCQPEVVSKVDRRGTMRGILKIISNALEKETSLQWTSHSSQERHWGVNVT